MRTSLIILFFVIFPPVLHSATVSYDVGGTSYDGYYVSAGENAPLLILVHDWDGLTEYEMKRAGMLKELGYNVFAVDLFGAGVRPTEIADKKRLTGELYKDREMMRALLDGGMEKALEISGNSDRGVVAFGYCFGGAAVLEFARSGAQADGFVSFHGGLKTPEGQDYRSTKGNVVVFHGTADKAVSMQEFAGLAVELEETGITHEMATYSGAPHAFTVFGSSRYHEQADKLSWARFVSYLEETLN